MSPSDPYEEARNDPEIQRMLADAGVDFDDVFVQPDYEDLDKYEVRSIPSQLAYDVVYKIWDAAIMPHSVIYRIDGGWIYAVGDSDVR